MPDLITTSAALDAIPTETLFAELHKAIEVTAAHLQKIANIWRELQRRGEDLRELRSGLWAYMPSIAAGKLRAETVVKFAGNASLLRAISTLPAEDQDKLLADQTVSVAVMQDGDRRTIWLKAPHLSVRQMRQVFGGGSIVPADKQIISPDPVHPRRDVASLAKSVPARRANGTKLVALTGLTFTEREMSIMQSRAKDAGVSVQRLVRAAIIKSGITADDGAV